MATFIGYVARGFPGAMVATVSIFAAPFLLVVVLGAWLLRMRSRRAVRSALRGLTPAVVGLMAAAAVTLGATLRGPPDVGIAAAAALTLTRFRVNPVIVLVLAGVVRGALHAAGV
jgi:chromate transporter